MDSSALPCFHCLGGVHPLNAVLHTKGILRRKHYQKFVSDVSPLNLTDNLYVFFGCNYTDDNSVAHHLSALFHVARQKIARMYRCVYKEDTNFSGETDERFWIIRKDICLFFCRIRAFVRRQLECHETDRDVNDIVRELLQCVRDLVLYMGTLSSLPSHVTTCIASTQGNKSLSLVYHFVHLCLDIKWSLLTILSDLLPFLEKNPNFPEGISFLPQSTIVQAELDCVSPFDQYVLLILWDVVGLALNIFRKIRLAEYAVITPFPCSCFKELVVLIGKVLDRRNEVDNREPFWITLHRIFQVILHEKDSEFNENDNLDSVHLNLIPDFLGTNKLGFCWWLLIHFAPLYEIDDCGDVYTPNQVAYKSNHFEVAHLCKLATQCEVYICTESQLRCYLRCCLAVCQKWETSMESPLILWEYFYKRLNDLFMDTGEVTVPGHGKSGLALFKHIQSLIDDNNDLQDNFTSYQLFLRFMYLQLRKSLASGSQREWKILKGRIFSKFHPRKIKELNISGLQNCFCLFLGLAALTDLLDVADKICDLLEMINPTILDLAKHSLIWRTLFSLMLIYQTEGKDLALPAQKMANNFNSLAGEFSQQSSGPVQNYFAPELLNIYMEGMQDIFEYSSTLNLSEYVLIASSFHEVLSQATSSDVQIALGAVEVILSRQKIMHQKRLWARNASEVTTGGSMNFRHYDALVEAIWDHVIPFVRDQVFGEANAKLVADLGNSITLFLLDEPPNPVAPGREAVSSMIQDFGFNLQTRSEVCCEYLINLLSQPNLLERPGVVAMVNFQAQLIRAWIRLGIQISADGIQDLTRLILCLPEMKKVFADSKTEPPSSSGYSEVIKSFLKALAIRQNTMDFNSRIAAKQTVAFYFADVMRVANVNFKGNNSPETLSSVYILLGRTIKTVPSLIYVPSKHDCIFCEIVNAAILPHTVFIPDSPIPQNLLESLRYHLPKFIFGISTLNYRRDPYIKQTLKNIFTHYLPRFPLKGTGSSVHPLVVSLLNARRRHPNGLDVIHFAIDVVREAYLMKRGSSLNQGINFIHELLICCSPEDCSTTSAILLPTLLKLMVLQEESLAKQCTLDIVKLVIDSCLAGGDESCRSTVEDSLKEFIRRHFNSHTDRMFALLRTLAKMYLKTVGSLVPFIAEQVSETERKQGCGTNGTLRSKLCEFALDVEAGFKLTRQDH